MPDRDAVLLDDLQRLAFAYFVREADPATGLVADNSRRGAPCSIAAVGFALTAYPIGVERGWMTRGEALGRCLRAARFFAHGAQGEGPEAIGSRGFFYHFLRMDTRRRMWDCEVSTIDTALLLAGLLCAAAYFAGDGAEERELRELVDAIQRRVDWRHALDHRGRDGDAPALAHGWTPERGMIPHRYTGWTEALVMYALAIGSPTRSVPASSWLAATRAHAWLDHDGLDRLHAAPLFIHQYSHLWLDLEGVADGYLASRGSDFAENTRRATLAQSRYAARNPEGFVGYDAFTWGFTAGDGPGYFAGMRAGERVQFEGYYARGAPFGFDDGTINPWAVAASLPFAPELCMATLESMLRRHPQLLGRYGLVSGFNRSCGGHGWFSNRWFGLDNGPIVIAIENLRTGMPWTLMKSVPAIAAGLRAAGCRGGWLEAELLRRAG
ncbi:MAG TPA: glucoamylase family protein [Planctomycetota bacterium]|nr:glucoamylase family protein [Planctomycetota bacterium]